MRLEGSLDAFSLPDILQLLSSTGKTGTLHLLREPCGQAAAGHGVVHLREGKVTGARSAVDREALLRRLVGSGLVTDDALAPLLAALADQTGGSAIALLVAQDAVPPEQLARVATEHLHDAVFELLRWSQGSFSFLPDEVDPDAVGLAVPAEQLITEGRRRLGHWTELVASIPSVHAVITLVPALTGDEVLTPPEWAMVSLIDGWRRVHDLVDMSGQGEYAVVAALAALVTRGLVTAVEVVADDPLARRHALLGKLEQRGEPGQDVAEPPAGDGAPGAGDPAIDQALLSRLMTGVRGL